MSSEVRKEFEILKMVQILQPSIWVPLSSRSINIKALPTTGTIAGRLKIDEDDVKKLLQTYEKAGLVTMKKLIARNVVNPSSGEDKVVYVYALSKKGIVRLKYLDENRDVFSRIWLRRWLYR